MMAVDQPPAVETVVVNAARLPTSLADAAFSIVTVDPNALQTLPRLDQVLETSPGVSLGGGLGSLSARRRKTT